MTGESHIETAITGGGSSQKAGSSHIMTCLAGGGGQQAGESHIQSCLASLLPPNLVNLVHWFDFTDPTTMFTDVGGTIPVAISADPIRHIANKGSNGSPLVQAGAAMTYEPGIVNGLSVGKWLTTEDIGDTIAAAGPTAWWMFGVAKRQSPDPSVSLEAWFDWGASNMRFATASTMTAFHISLGTIDTGVTHVTNTWYAQSYFGNTGSSGYQASGAAEVAGGASSGAAVGPGSFLRLGATSVFPGEIGEALVYTGIPTVADRIAAFAYADAKYATLPHT